MSSEHLTLTYLAWLILPKYRRCVRLLVLRMDKDTARLCRACAIEHGFEADGEITDKGRQWAKKTLEPYVSLM